MRLARAYLAEGRHLEAMVVSKKAIKQWPGRVDLHLLLAKVHRAGRDVRRAEESLAAARRLAGPGDS
ncbi:MAG: hypothetical protein AMXMBFR34_48990 [Myxococcaceae bacterium]